MRPGSYPSVLRNLHWSPLILDMTMALFILALLPLDDTAHGNVLSLLAEKVRTCYANVVTADDQLTFLAGGGALAADLGSCGCSRRSLCWNPYW